jgi:hypothetical protein
MPKPNKYTPATNTAPPARVEIKPRNLQAEADAKAAVSGWLCKFVVTCDQDHRRYGTALSPELPTGVDPKVYFAGQNYTLGDDLAQFLDETPRADKHFVISGYIIREPLPATEEWRNHITNNAVIQWGEQEMVEIPKGQIMKTAEGVITQRHSASLTPDVIEELLRNARGALKFAIEEREKTGTYQQRREQA